MSTPSVISLFTGAGGLDLGLEQAGFRVALCVEMDGVARDTLRQNRPRWPIAEPPDIHLLLDDGVGNAVLDQSSLGRGEAELLAGGPPCQPFSKSGYWATGDSQRLGDPRASTLAAYLQVLEATLPQVVLLENVEGLGYKGKAEGRHLLEQGLARINGRCRTRYHPVFLRVNAADYGVPQARARVFMVAHRDGRLLRPPARTHFAPDSAEHTEEAKPRYRTAWDAIGDLDSKSWPKELNATGKWAALLPSVPEGHNYLWHTPESHKEGGGEPIFPWRSRYWSFLLKLAKDRPSWTIQAEPGPATGPFHWRSRKLSVRELCRLQTFPDSYEIRGSYRAAYRQLGNAVPPALGELIGLEIRRQLLGHVCRSDLKLVPDERPGCPQPEMPLPVPLPYLRCKGNHQPHPGAGKGPGALRRLESNEDDQLKHQERRSATAR